MKLKVAFINERISNLRNYKGEQLHVHTMIIHDSDLETDRFYGTTIYKLESTFLPKWKQRDIEVRTLESKRIIESLERDPSQIGGEIIIRFEPDTLPMFSSDSYEDDCRLLELDDYCTSLHLAK